MTQEHQLSPGSRTGSRSSPADRLAAVPILFDWLRLRTTPQWHDPLLEVLETYCTCALQAQVLASPLVGAGPLGGSLQQGLDSFLADAAGKASTMWPGLASPDFLAEPARAATPSSISEALQQTRARVTELRHVDCVLAVILSVAKQAPLPLGASFVKSVDSLFAWLQDQHALAEGQCALLQTGVGAHLQEDLAQARARVLDHLLDDPVSRCR